MRKSWIFLAGLAVCLFTGCASSDRMARMSGGILDEYSAPPSYRLRSKKFQKMSRSLDSGKRANSPAVAGLDQTLVNIWPFFFRNDAYWSILWPLIDYDDYGMAFRPFYVQDGDEHSILFPLSGWNSQAENGWVANFAWTDSGFGMIPFCWQENNGNTGWFYYTPLLIHKYNKFPMNPHRFSRTDYFTEFCLAYGSRKTEVIQGDWDWLFSYVNPKNIKGNPVLNYHFAKRGIPAPQSEKELREFREKIFRQLPQEQRRKYGFFPLFNRTEFADNGSSFYLFPFDTVKKKNYFQWKLLFGLLATYENSTIDPENGLWDTGSDRLTIIPLLTGFKENTKFQNVGAVKTLRTLRQLDESKPYSQNLPRIKELIKELDPAIKLPETVVDYATLHLFLNEWTKGKQFLTEVSKSGGNPLIYLYDINKSRTRHIMPILLTGYEKTAKKTNFWSIPLLTFKNKTEYSDFLGIIPPLGVIDSAKKNPKYFTKKIFSSTSKSAPEWDTVEEQNRYYLCGLFYQGKIAFNVAKKGFNYNQLEQIRKDLKDLAAEYTQIQNEWKRIAKERKRNAAWITKNKIEHYKKLIREEELNIQETNLRDRESKYQEKQNQLKKAADSIQFSYTEKEIQKPAEAEQAIRRLVKNYTELRWKKDIGNGILFRKEAFYNGDYNWRLLGFLAGGEKTGTKENTRVLHMVYRHRKDGNRSETLFFPFVSIQEDGEDSKFSFLWRVFQLSRKQGKTSGYFCFIPF